MSAVARVRPAVWVGEMQFDGRMGRGMVMSAAIRERSAVYVRGV